MIEYCYCGNVVCNKCNMCVRIHNDCSNVGGK